MSLGRGSVTEQNVTVARVDDRHTEGTRSADARSSDEAAPAIEKIAFFAHDSAETVVIKRAKSFQAAGSVVVGFMFRRQRDKEHPVPAWRNIALGTTIDRNYLARLPKLFSGLLKALKHRSDLRDCDVIYARNFDMMAIATIAKWLSRSPAQLVYEVLDVQRPFVGTSALNRLFRWCERRLLAACDLLVVSSPMFMTRYFETQQGYAGPWFLLENKVSGSDYASVSHDAREGPTAGPPWIIGWFGRLRCPKSLDILSQVARSHPDKVKVYMRGTLSQEDITELAMMAATSGRPNMMHYGAYESPRDLSDIYSQVHFTWAMDFLDAGSNSDWLLPNRLYEGGLFGAISIARENTATGEMVAREGLGVALKDPIERSLSDWLLDMDEDQYKALAAAARRVPFTRFVDDNDTAALLRLLGSRMRHSRGEAC